MKFVGWKQLHRDILDFAARLPKDLVGVIGVPRSGLMVASLISLLRNEMGLGCPEGEDLWFPTGTRRRRPMPRSGTVLVMDDSSATGDSVNRAAEIVRDRLEGSQYKVITASMYVVPAARDSVDYWHRVVNVPRIFAWNWVGSAFLSSALLDIDGVVCRDPEVFDNDGEEYQAAIREATPTNIPTRHVGGFVTGRLDRWRDITTGWLDGQGITYGDLFMFQAATAAERRTNGNVSVWKGEMLKDGPWKWMIESHARNASIIAATAFKPVVCLEDEKVY